MRTRYKLDNSFSNTNWYTYVPSNPDGQRCQLVDAVIAGRFVTDPHESVALVARPRSKSAGARAGVQGSIDDEFDLAAAPLEFSPSSDAHISKPCPISELCSGKSPVFRESHGYLETSNISQTRFCHQTESALRKCVKGRPAGGPAVRARTHYTNILNMNIIHSEAES